MYRYLHTCNHILLFYFFITFANFSVKDVQILKLSNSHSFTSKYQYAANIESKILIPIVFRIRSKILILGSIISIARGRNDRSDRRALPFLCRALSSEKSRWAGLTFDCNGFETL